MHQKRNALKFMIFMLFPFNAQASHDCTEWVAKAISIQGRVEMQRPKDFVWIPISNNETFCYGDKIRTTKNSRAILIFQNESRVTLDQNSTLIFSSGEEENTSWFLNLIEGAGFFRSRHHQHLTIETPFINAVHEGTEFLVAVDSKQTEITVFDGQVAAKNSLGEIRIKKGYRGIARKDYPPVIHALTIRPEDAVQWTLYYPPIMDYQSLASSKTTAFQPALNAYQQGKLGQTLELLENTTASKQNSNYLIFKASLLLTIGRVDEAQKSIDQVLLTEANYSQAYALQSIIAVTKNRQDDALTLAKKAVSIDPQSVVAKIALSYAYQSKFDIESALKVTEEAVQLSPDNALAWARLSELQLSTGERSDALESAKKAQQLNPELDRTQTILGFAYLAQIDIDEAKAAFSKAINLNSADPLARLGLGLAKIRTGDIEEGTSDLETAVSLDPDNAIMRSYLGKAYYELKNDGFAGTELAIAKEMDSNDPTPWFYDAIRKQTTNRPVEALHDMQKAIELNDNRGVYRSKLLLDEDLAARSASLGRIYNDLGFQQLGLVEGWKSVNTDPSNYSAHRLLADNYAALPRHEIARVSELLQSQLLQPMNMTPVQPQLAESSLLTVNGNGPSSLSFNEFNSIYTSNQISLQTSGIFGNHNTWGDEVIQSGLWEDFSYSLGQFHYETDGYRENNDIEQDLYNVFAQYRLTPEISIQAEYRRSELNRGDIDINFDENDFSISDRFELNQDIFRIGSHYEPSKNSDILMSFIYSNQDGIQTQILPSGFQDFKQKIEENNEEEGYQAELRYLFHNNWFKFTTGGGVSIINGEEITSISLLADPCPVLNCQRPPKGRGIKTRHYNGYIYTETLFPKNLTWTLGISLDSFEDKPFDFTSSNPKFGLQWQVLDRILLRLAAFKTLKRVLLVDQTVEPTQIAGFNQFFDDRNGTKSVLYGAGIDINFTKKLQGGMEVSRRNIKIPTIIRTNTTDYEKINFQDQKEELYKAYLYWTPTSNLAFSIEPQYEKYRNKDREILNEPNFVNTFTFPITARFFNELGLFAKVGLTYLHQKINQQWNFQDESGENDEKVFLLDTGIGYRFPKRLGLVSFEINNILNEKFQFQDSNFRLSQKRKRTARFVPDRSIFAKVTINF